MNAKNLEKKDSGSETAIVAAGCFWGVEEILRGIDGVVDTEVGFTGGTLDNPTYEDVITGRTGHAEAVRITFDPDRISYERLLDYFFKLHDPTTMNRQDNDVGTQYRSAIFYDTDAQKEIAERVRKRVDGSGRWARPVVTEIVPAWPFYSAEEYHQEYYKKHAIRYRLYRMGSGRDGFLKRVWGSSAGTPGDG